jgi:hypothetical protein
MHIFFVWPRIVSAFVMACLEQQYNDVQFVTRKGNREPVVVVTSGVFISDDHCLVCANDISNSIVTMDYKIENRTGF